MHHAFGQVTIDLEPHVTTIVHAIQGIGAFACQIEHSLRIDINEFELCG